MTPQHATNIRANGIDLYCEVAGDGRPSWSRTAAGPTTACGKWVVPELTNSFRVAIYAVAAIPRAHDQTVAIRAAPMRPISARSSRRSS